MTSATGVAPNGYRLAPYPAEWGIKDKIRVGPVVSGWYVWGMARKARIQYPGALNDWHEGLCAGRTGAERVKDRKLDRRLKNMAKKLDHLLYA